jgi:hypothetical protein
VQPEAANWTAPISCRVKTRADRRKVGWPLQQIVRCIPLSEVGCRAFQSIEKNLDLLSCGHHNNKPTKQVLMQLSFHDETGALLQVDVGQLCHLWTSADYRQARGKRYCWLIC